MTQDTTKSSTLKQIIAAVVIAMLVGGTSPWWWKEIFGDKDQGYAVKPATPTGAGPSRAVTSPVRIKRYLMDRQSNRVIVVTHLQSNEYRIEEPTSPWPWEGTARIDGGQLSGQAKFRNSLATMRVEGVIRGDDSIVIRYVFITGSDGKPAAGRIDNHVWYPSG